MGGSTHATPWIRGAVGFYAGSGYRLVVDSAGQVGIGTTDPDEFMHIQKDQNNATVIKLENNTAGTGASIRTRYVVNSGTAHVVLYDDGVTDANFAGKFVLYSDTAGQDIKINTRGNGDLEFASTSDATELKMSSGNFQTNTFTSGFAGAGWQISSGSVTSAEFDNLIVRGTMSIYELLINQVRATNGSLWISGTGKADSVSGTGPYTLTFDEGEGYGHGFVVGDLIRAQR